MDKEYLARRINEISNDVFVNDKYVHFTYKDMRFVSFCVEGDFPLFFLKDTSLVYPHVILLDEAIIDGNNVSAICLFEAESIVKHRLNAEERIDYAIMKLIELFNLSPAENIKEIHLEYKYHWHKSFDAHFVSMLPYCDEYNDVTIFRYKKKNTNDKQKTIISKSFPYDTREYSITNYNCVYISLNDICGILPPSIKPWNNETIIDILFNLKRTRITYEDYERIDKLYVKDSITFIFRVPEYDFFEFGFRLDFADTNRKKLRDKLESTDINISFIKIENKTIENSLFRNGQQPIRYKKVVLIGTGSLGSYIAGELVKQGIKELTLIDGDSLSNENISRHYLGSLFIDWNKADAMKTILSVSYPYLKVSSIEKKITSKNIKEVLDRIDADLIIVSTGNEDTELLINNYVHQREKFIPTCFCWLEANGIGSHIFFLKNKKGPCFNCVLSNDISFVKDPLTYKIKNGCGGTYTKYGTYIILNTLVMLQRILCENSEDNNCLYSYKEEITDINSAYLTDLYFSLEKGLNQIEISQLQGCICNGQL